MKKEEFGLGGERVCEVGAFSFFAFSSFMMMIMMMMMMMMMNNAGELEKQRGGVGFYISVCMYVCMYICVCIISLLTGKRTFAF